MKFTAYHNGKAVTTFANMAEAMRFIANQPDRLNWSLAADLCVKNATPI